MKLLSALVSLAVLLGACQASEEAPRPSTPKLPPSARRLTSNSAMYLVAFVPEPDPIVVNQPVKLRVWVVDGGGKGPLLNTNQIALSVDAVMPEHQHGMTTEAAVHADDKGTFEVSGVLLHMPGRWQLYFDVTRAGITERAQCDLTLE
jgi:hypothetical protein